MNTVTKTLALISILCYLAVSSVAAVHAFPVLSKSADVGDTLVMTGDSSLDHQPSCHQSSDISPDNAASVLCKIFCSAIGHAMVTDTASEAISLVPLIQVSALNGSLVTRQLSVERQPPR